MSDSDLIHVVDPGYDWGVWPWVFIPLTLIVLGLIVSFISYKASSSRRSAESAWGFFHSLGVLAIIFAVASPAAAGIIGTINYGATVDSMKISEMSKLGYNAIEFDRNSDEIFTAYRDGKMVRGVSLKLEPLTWQVVQIDTPDFK